MEISWSPSNEIMMKETLSKMTNKHSSRDREREREKERRRKGGREREIKEKSDSKQLKLMNTKVIIETSKQSS